MVTVISLMDRNSGRANMGGVWSPQPRLNEEVVMSTQFSIGDIVNLITDSGKGKYGPDVYRIVDIEGETAVLILHFTGRGPFRTTIDNLVPALMTCF
jgi:hypothetical protein